MELFVIPEFPFSQPHSIYTVIRDKNSFLALFVNQCHAEELEHYRLFGMLGWHSIPHSHIVCVHSPDGRRTPLLTFTFRFLVDTTFPTDRNIER